MAQTRVDSGLLIPVVRDVFTLPGVRLGSKGRFRAAVHSGGEGCALSHLSSLALHGLVKDRLPVHVTRTGGGSRTEVGPVKFSSEFGFRIVSHQSRSFRREQATVVDGIRTTSVERALLEFSAQARGAEIGKALTQGERERKIRWDRLEEVISTSTGHKGIGLLRAEFEFFDPVFVDAASDREENFLRFIGRRNLPMPAVNVWLDPYIVDFLWRELMLIVELDPWGTHRGRRSFQTDRRKSVVLETRGFRVIRITGDDFYFHEERTGQELEAIMHQQAAMLGVTL